LGEGVESVIFLDTHAVIWLYSGQLGLFNPKVLKLINTEQVCISHIVKLEIQYLYEIKRVKYESGLIIDTLIDEIGLMFSDNNFDSIVRQSIHLSFTRDPFDRIIVADASINNSKLISKDRNLKKHYKNTIW
jgi:PIN domain nuclease of toxin-antitoxin system